MWSKKEFNITHENNNKRYKIQFENKNTLLNQKSVHGM